MPVPSHPKWRFPWDSHRNDIPMDKPGLSMGHIYLSHSHTIAIYACPIPWDVSHEIPIGIPFPWTNLRISVPSKKILHWANVCFVAHEAHGIAQPCRHINSEAFPTLKRLCDIYMYILYKILNVGSGENERALRKLVLLRILEGTLPRLYLEGWSDFTILSCA